MTLLRAMTLPRAMTPLSFETEEPAGPRFALVVLQADETLEGDMRRLLPAEARLHVTRVAAAQEVSAAGLLAMRDDLARAASLLPAGRYDAVAYGCTSGAAVIGSAVVAAQLREGCEAAAVVDPLSALLAACRTHGVRRLGFVSPYVEAVNRRLVERLAEAGIAVPHLASFGVADDHAVVCIAPASVERAAREMAAREVDAVFLSCTNLRTLDAIERLDARVPVWSSNLLLARELERATNESLT